MDDDHSDWKIAAKAVPELRFLKVLVTGLTLVMGLGMITIVVLLWLRLGSADLPQIPENISLPDGESVAAITFSQDWTAIVTQTGQILLYDRQGRLRNQISATAP